jgi:hypothetical protein
MTQVFRARRVHAIECPMIAPESPRGQPNPGLRSGSIHLLIQQLTSVHYAHPREVNFGWLRFSTLKEQISRSVIDLLRFLRE